VAAAQLDVAALGDGAAALAAHQAAFQYTQEQLLAASSHVLAGQTGAWTQCTVHTPPPQHLALSDVSLSLTRSLAAMGTP